MNSDDRVDEERVLFRGEAACVYCADFQDYPEAGAGETMTVNQVVVSSGNAALVALSTPFVNSVAFEKRDRDGDVERTVPAGKGVKVGVTPPPVGGAKGYCVVTFLADFSGGPPNGSTRAKRVKFTVK